MKYMQLSGTIPASVGSLAAMEFFEVKFNLLTGTLPPFLDGKHLPLLVDLSLSNNPLHGTIPLSLGSMSRMISMRLSTMKLTGSLPKSMGSLSSMKQ
jgi:hypothetical protein